MELEIIQLVHEAIASGDWVDAANLAFEAEGSDVTVETKAEAFTALKALESNLAAQKEYQKVSVLLWGDGMFNSRPSVVQQVFHEVLNNSKLLICGASSLSKTFSCGVLYYLLWRTDPYWTAVKLAAPSETHLYGNLFSHLVALHRASVLPMTENDSENIDINETELFISMHDALPEMRIQGVLCKQNQVSAGALRGHKPKPYRKPSHPVLGQWTNLFILIDEGSQVSPGAFEDLKTTEASIDETKGNVKIVIAFNPEEVSDKVVQMAEPEEGWDIEQVDTLYKWVSKLGYPVLRLDGKRFENVVQRKNVYQGMLSYEAYLGFLKAGEHSGQYWAKGRGFPPLKDNAYTIVSAAWMQSQRGEPIYVNNVKNIGILDTALQGADKALFGVGRWGEASGWTNYKGEITMFKDRTNPDKEITRFVATLDQIFQLPKTESTVQIMQEVMGRCKTMGISPEDLVMDKTGNASGTYSHAKTYWGDVLGVDFGTKADESKVLAEDLNTAYDLYDGKVTELWFAAKRWMDPTVCALLVNPIVPTSPLFTHITTRRYRNVKGGRVRVEPKEEYKARNQGVSPDEADILCLLVEWCRQRGGVTPGIVEKRDTDNSDKLGAKVSKENLEEYDSLESAEFVSNNLDEA